MPAQLTYDQVKHFYRLWFGVLQFVNEQQKLVPAMLGKDFSSGVSTKDALKIAGFIWTHTEIFDDFSKAEKLNQIDSAIIIGWQKYHCSGKFYIVRHLKDGAVFLSTEENAKAYLVKGLVDSLEDMWPKQSLPLMLETVLMPFENVITTCGLFYLSNVFFGGNISREIREDCQQAEITYGLITSLPHTQTVSREDKDIAQIKFYLSSEKNLELYWDDLHDLVLQNSKLYWPPYYQQRGLLEAKTYKKELRRLNVKKLNFAFYGETVIAAHVDLKQVEETVKKLVPSKELEMVVYDKI